MSGTNPVVRVFRFLWRFLQGFVKAIQVLIFLVFFAIVLSAISNLSGGGFRIPESAALILAPSGVLVEQFEGEPLDRALLAQDDGDPQTLVRDVIDALEYAATDDRIEAVVLLPGYLQGGGLSKEQAIADAMRRFKESGKPIISMADSYDQNQYFLAAYADEIYMHDFGFVLIEGFGYYKAYFADALEKLQVDVNVFRVGEFKSFVEPYLRNTMSEDDRAASERWLEALWAAWQRDVSEARGLEPEVLDRYVDDVVGVLAEAEGDAGRAALDAGLVDGLMSHQQFRDYMIAKVGVSEDEPDTFAQVDFRTYLFARDAEEGLEESDPEANVAVVVASGEIVDGEASPGTVGSATVARLIRQAAADESVEAIVLQIDSPGGSMFASEVIFDQLEAVRASGRPVVASMSSVAASGGYYIAMGADEIWASETTISGSIGVGALFPTFQRSLGELGVNIDGFGTTPLTGQLSPLRELGDEARKLLDLSVKSAYDVFISKVATARDMDKGRVDDVAQGRVWIGEDAYGLGLVDQIGDIDDAIASAAAMAGLTDGDYDVYYVERELTLAEQILLQYAKLLGMLLGAFDQPAGAAELARLLGIAERELNVMSGWNDPRGIYYHCLCEIR